MFSETDFRVAREKRLMGAWRVHDLFQDLPVGLTEKVRGDASLGTHQEREDFLLRLDGYLKEWEEVARMNGWIYTEHSYSNQELPESISLKGIAWLNISTDPDDTTPRPVLDQGDIVDVRWTVEQLDDLETRLRQ